MGAWSGEVAMTRRTATLIWAALLGTPLLFLGVAAGVSEEAYAPRLAEPLFWLAVAGSALNVALSRVLPPRLGPGRATDREAVAFTRLLVGLALCDAAAMAPIVAYMITRDPRLLAVLALDVVAYLLLYPSGPRWQRLMPEPVGAPAPRRAS
jgi:hypothetical protein